jgi:hypothetical protein
VIQKLTPELVEKANTASGSFDGRAFGLVGHYKKCYEEKYNTKINVNLHKYKYIALEVLNEFDDYEKVKKVVEYYFTTSKAGHPIEWMLKNFYEILESYDSAVKDKAIRQERRKELAKIRQEWLNGDA